MAELTGNEALELFEQPKQKLTADHGGELHGALAFLSEVIETRPPGYVLALHAEDVDAYRFEGLVGEGRVALGEGRTEAAIDCFDKALSSWRGDALADLGGSESKSTKSSASPAAMHSSEITAMESPGEVKTVAPPKLKTAKSSTSSRPKVHASKASSNSKHVKSGGSRGRVVAKLATKISVKTASSKSSVKNATKTASNG